MSAPDPTRCPSCRRSLCEGAGIYACELCGEDCCTSCSDTTAKHSVVCDDCLEDGYDDGWTQGEGFSTTNQNQTA